MKLASSDFEIFDLPQRFAVDGKTLNARWHALQTQIHPDRFTGEGSAAQRLAMQWATRVNEAYRRLKNPLQRAAYLCELGGAPIQAEDNTAMPADFLVQQMSWREALDDAGEIHEIEHLSDEIDAHRQVLLSQISHTLDELKDFSSAADQVRALMFVERLIEDIDRRLEALGQ